MDQRYLAKVNFADVRWPASRPNVGDQLDVGDEYLSHALDLFEIAGTLLCQSVWRKLAPSEAEDRHSFIGGGLIRAVYDCLLSSNWYVAEHLSRWGAADSVAEEEDRLIHTLNNWLSIKRQDRIAEIAEQLTSFDSSAKHPRFLIGLACLRDSPDAFFEQLPGAVASGVTPENLREWPILEEVRGDSRFEKELKKLEATAAAGLTDHTD